MKNSKIFTCCMFLCMGTLLLTTSCSKDEESPALQEENTAPFEAALFNENLELPSAIISSSAPKAQELEGEFEMMTVYMEDSGIMEIPPGAVVSHDPVQTGSNRPTENTVEPEYTVYTYTAGGATIVYQFSVQNGYDVFEMFYDVTNDTLGLIKYYEIRQSLDGTNGTMSWFVGQNEPIFLWTWQVNADDSIFITMDYAGVAHYEMMIYADNSGYLEIYNQNALYLDWHWNSDGSGTWTNYQSGDSGSW